MDQVDRIVHNAVQAVESLLRTQKAAAAAIGELRTIRDDDNPVIRWARDAAVDQLHRVVQQSSYAVHRSRAVEAGTRVVVGERA